MEIQRGTVTGLKALEGKKNKAECHVDQVHVILNQDLEGHVNDGDEVIVAGIKDNDTLSALALNNISKKKYRNVDGSNLVLILGASGFFAFLGFVLGVQYLMAGITLLSSLNGALSFAGIVGVIAAILRLMALKKASSEVKTY